MTEAQAYEAGWAANRAGIDARYCGPTLTAEGYSEDDKYAWLAGWLDAMEADDDETCEPDAAGFSTY